MGYCRRGANDNNGNKESDTDLRGNYALPLQASWKKKRLTTCIIVKLLCDVENVSLLLPIFLSLPCLDNMHVCKTKYVYFLLLFL